MINFPHYATVYIDHINLGTWASQNGETECSSVYKRVIQWSSEGKGYIHTHTHIHKHTYVCLLDCIRRSSHGAAERQPTGIVILIRTAEYNCIPFTGRPFGCQDHVGRASKVYRHEGTVILV